MATQIRRLALAVLGTVLLAGCGGGEFGQGGDVNPPPGPPVPVASALRLLPSSNVLPSNVDDPTDPGAVILTAIAKDSNNNVVPGVPVSFSASNGGTLVVTRAITNENGQATATLDTGGDPTLRVITVRATAGSLSASTDIQVVNPATGAPPALLNVLLDSPQLSSNASSPSEGVTLTAVVRDSSNNVVSGVPVSFSTTDSGEIVVEESETDSNGRATATLNTGGDPTNRTINVTVTAGSLSRVVSVDVVGTTLFISGLDSTQIGTPTTYVAQLNDSGGDGIPGRAVTFSTNSGNTLSATTVVTDAGGQATVVLTPTVAATTLTARALGLTATQAIRVSTDQFTFLAPAPDAEVNIGTNRTVSVRWLQGGNPVPDGTVINFATTRGTLSATFATTTNGVASVTLRSAEAGLATIVASSTFSTRPSAELEIEFVATTPASIDLQPSPATVSTNQSSDITAVVRDPNNNAVKNKVVEFSLSDSTGGSLSSATAVTNSQGVAVVRYTASSQSSASRSVVITGTVRGTSISDTTSITVGGSAVRISMGTGATLVVKDQSTYQAPYTVLVSDSAGNPVPEAEFRLQIQPLRYLKGTRSGGRVFCPNEDVNRNDILDPGEDMNRNGILDPGRPASVPATVELDPDDGTGQFFVTYPKEFGQFLEVDIFGIASVSGTEAVEVRRLILNVTEADFPNLPDASPFGTDLDCSSRF